MSRKTKAQKRAAIIQKGEAVIDTPKGRRLMDGQWHRVTRDGAQRLMDADGPFQGAAHKAATQRAAAGERIEMRDRIEGDSVFTEMRDASGEIIFSADTPEWYARRVREAQRTTDTPLLVRDMQKAQVDDLVSGNVDALLTPQGAQDLIDKGYGREYPDLFKALEDVVAGRGDLRMRVKERLPNDTVNIEMQPIPKPSQGSAFRRAPGVEHELDVMHEIGAGNVPISFAEQPQQEQTSAEEDIAARFPATAARKRDGKYMPPWTGEEGSWSRRRDLLEPYLITPRNLKPAGMPHVRQVLMTNLADERSRSPKPPPIALPEEWGMYYASAEFTSLLEQMQQDWGMTEDVLSYWQDVVAEQGMNGQFVVAFDPTRLPWMRIANTKQMIMSDEWQRQIDEDPYIERTDDVYVLRAQVQALTVQWRLRRVLEGEPPNGAGLQPMEVDLYFGLYTRGHTFRTAVNGSYTSRDAILICWMLTSPLLRMLESKTVKAGAGLPPRAKAAMPRKHREAAVTIVNLRHAVRQQVKDVEHAATKGREYTHRFLVRGHWRNQACGKGWSEHRRVYVLPYVKGPDGAPFSKKEKVLKW